MQASKNEPLSSLEIDGRRVAFLDVGRGSAVLLAHCSSASHKQWGSLTAGLSSRYRVFAPDLVGYGRSDPWPPDQPLDPLADVTVLLRLADLSDGPVHLAAHSYGGAAALEAARLLGERVRSLTLIEPVAFHLLRLAGRAREWAEIHAVARRVRSAVQRGWDRRAAAAYMGFWIGRLRWLIMPPRVRRGIVATVGKVAAEFGIMDQLSTPLAEYARIVVPTRLIAGGRTRRPARAVTDVLLDTLPAAHLRVLPTAGHMSPFTHGAEINALITEHIDDWESGGPR